MGRSLLDEIRFLVPSKVWNPITFRDTKAAVETFYRSLPHPDGQVFGGEGRSLGWALRHSDSDREAKRFPTRPATARIA